jgi:hypothetical protein
MKLDTTPTCMHVHKHNHQWGSAKRAARSALCTAASRVNVSHRFAPQKTFLLQGEVEIDRVARVRQGKADLRPGNFPARRTTQYGACLIPLSGHVRGVAAAIHAALPLCGCCSHRKASCIDVCSVLVPLYRTVPMFA